MQNVSYETDIHKTLEDLYQHLLWPLGHIYFFLLYYLYNYSIISITTLRNLSLKVQYESLCFKTA